MCRGRRGCRGARKDAWCQASPKHASWPTHSCGNTARKAWSWPNFWANVVPFSPGQAGALGLADVAGEAVPADAGVAPMHDVPALPPGRQPHLTAQLLGG
jgi:hypothetical protein